MTARLQTKHNWVGKLCDVYQNHGGIACVPASELMEKIDRYLYSILFGHFRLQFSRKAFLNKVMHATVFLYCTCIYVFQKPLNLVKAIVPVVVTVRKTSVTIA